MIVVVSFTWGIFIFHERVKSIPGAIGAGCLLVLGLIGMSRYSAPVVSSKDARYAAVRTTEQEEEEEETEAPQDPPSPGLKKKMASLEIAGVEGDMVSNRSGVADDDSATPSEPDNQHASLTSVLCVRCTQRQLGICLAAINGVWGGSNLIPYHFAMAHGVEGLEYAISFGAGSLLVLTGMWILRFLYYLGRERSLKAAYESLPDFHFRQLGLPGTLAGAFFFIGKVFSIIAVSILGQGVGYSLTQLSMLVSGLWGIFYYGEITETHRIWKWFFSACVTISGILWLSYEHEKSHD
eukprot:CAMPEP_0172506148 /NCGR_PEP_ID=MMETSP1066-20121228/192197_1 /TAXON_ID=671091 /ORGANISM="Coscinodiscus wailesii, Strain CCMP2513" /LENGTH=294 /DNA_ID=CAMNT_0013283039 /DNA_START=488 /DNA_END=1372 /DNA_ORIENTATION=-